MTPRAFEHAALAALLANTTSCVAGDSILRPAGVQAQRIGDLFWLFTAVSVVVVAGIVLALALAALRPRAPMEGERAGLIEPERRKRLALHVGIAAALSVAALLFLLVATLRTGRALASLQPPSDPRRAITIEVVGRQWWWQVNYLDLDPGKQFTTANEIHVPVGTTVNLLLSSRDVIHSFWVPRLHGKRDLIPGYETKLTLRADSPGVYRGQCAEFCGFQHAHMGLSVIAEPAQAFERWRQAQRAPAAAPASDATRRGQQVFLSASCTLCHTISGTAAGSGVGPDLTHLMNRSGLAAQTLTNTEANLTAWILDPQGIKPGASMPPSNLPREDIRPLVAYLMSLR
jgi:cytochrome c oxidase subunit II